MVLPKTKLYLPRWPKKEREKLFSEVASFSLASLTKLSVPDKMLYDTDLFGLSTTYLYLDKSLSKLFAC